MRELGIIQITVFKVKMHLQIHEFIGQTPVKMC